MLEASGQVGRDLLRVDWTATALGPPEDWPLSLQNTVRILLTSRFSMWMAWGPELTFLCNDAYRRDTLGAKYPWALGRPASEVWSEIWPDISPRIERVMRTGEATWDESLLLFLQRSGFLEETYHTFSYSPLANDAGRVQGMLCVVQEDTDQVLATRRMQTLRDLGTRRQGTLTQAETVRFAAEQLAGDRRSMPFSLIYLFDDDGRTARLVATSGVPEGHPVAAPLLVGGDEDAAWPVTQLAQGRTVVVGDLPSRFDDLPCGDWSEPPLQAVCAPLLQQLNARPSGFLVTAANRYRPMDDSVLSFVQLLAGQVAAAVTDARSYEFERRRAEQLAQLDRAKTDFFTNVSHEFRTPLTLLLGPAEDALADQAQPLPPAQRGRLDVIRRNGQRLLKLVNSLLDFSRLEGNRTQPLLEPVQLDRYTVELASMFESAARRAGVELVIDCPPLPAPVPVDREHYAKIVLNLLSNALKFTFEGAITVRLQPVDDVVELSVSDTGTGIPKAEQPLLFERFHRVPGARSRTHEGSGIGLALVAELVTQHGGSVAVESEPSQGSTFTVRLPLRADSSVVAGAAAPTDLASTRQHAQGFVLEALRWMDDEPPTASSAVQTPPASARDGRPRVLVVDDNADMRQYVCGLLSVDYEVTTAVDGQEALEAALASPPDLVLTDVMMPRLDGFGLLAALRTDERTATLPVVMLSARAGEDGTVEGLQAGADDYLVKPFSSRELQARVRVNLELDRARRTRRTLERSRAQLDQAQRLARVGSWELDAASGSLTASLELSRIIGRSQHELDELGSARLLAQVVHADDRSALASALRRGLAGVAVRCETRVLLPDGGERLVRVHGELASDEDDSTPVLRGSVQDITEQRLSEQALATAAAREEAAAREHSIADELQRSLLPERSFALEHLDVATYYRSGVEGTQVGGDWYDVIELGAGRTALVVGDVMGRGVRAAAVMGQLRSGVRALAKLDVQPAEVVEHLDSLVQDLGEDQIVTCVYAIFDATDQTLRFANAGHLPPLLVRPGASCERLVGGSAPPLGTGVYGVEAHCVQLEPGAIVGFYTDGLVERRGRDLDDGIDDVAAAMEQRRGVPLDDLPEHLVRAGMPEGPDDDVALLLARVNAQPYTAAVTWRLGADSNSAIEAREAVQTHLRGWGVSERVVEDMVIMASELVGNAVVHGRPPVDVRLHSDGANVVLEVADRAADRPRRQHAGAQDESGRGIHIVSTLADDWGSRATGHGKSVWCTLSVERRVRPRS